MSLLSLHTWNEVDTSNTRDYSTNRNDSTTMVVTSILALTGNGEIGSAVIMDGVNDVITFGDVMDFEGIDNLTIVAKVRISSTKEQVLAGKAGQWEVGFDVSQKAFLRITIGAAEFELTSASSVTTGGDYKIIVWTYDGGAGANQGKIYIDGVLDANTMTQTGNLDASASNFLIGSDLTDYYAGRIEMLSGHTNTFIQSEVDSATAKPGGFILDIPDTSEFSEGDLLESSTQLTPPKAQGVVTGILSSTQILYYPMANDIPNMLDQFRRRGNVFDTSRQWLLESVISSSDIVEHLKDGVNDFSKADSATSQPGGYEHTTAGLLWNTLIAPNREISPAILTVDQNDWNPADATDPESTLATCNTISFSVSSPAIDVTGIQAPIPAVPQVIILVNVGSSNTTLKNNDAGSLAANRFLHSGNTSINAEDSVIIKYDVSNARWRVISIT